MFLAPADMLGGDVVAAPSDSRSYALDMKLGAGKADVPHVKFDTLWCGLHEQTGDRVGAKGGFEGKVFALSNSAHQKFHALAFS